jgi:hypothetical protein
MVLAEVLDLLDPVAHLERQVLLDHKEHLEHQALKDPMVLLVSKVLPAQLAQLETQVQLDL